MGPPVTESVETGLLAALFRRRSVRAVSLVLAVLAAFLLLFAGHLWQRFGADRATEYADIEEHFKYGSTGGEHESGFPYWIFQALPQVCAKHLPGDGYASLGLIFEDGKDLPVGMSKRRHQGIDKTFLNCAVCHASTVRDAPGAKPRLYLGMPAKQLDIMAFEKFFFNCAKDPKFAAEFIVPEARRLAQASGQDFDLLDRYVVYPVAVALMRERLLMLAGRFGFVLDQPAWGPGRVDTFNSAKVIFNFPMDALSPAENDAPADFPSIWLQGQRQGMQLHWDGNNTMVEERNKSAAFGTGTTPPTHRPRQRRTDRGVAAHPRAAEVSVSDRRREGGARRRIYKEYCAACHGASGRNFAGSDVGKVTAIAAIGTDRRRLDSYTYDLAVNQATLYAGYDWRFRHFRKTFGYANLPLDGLWLRAPYLHNGSVPNVRDLLEPAANRAESLLSRQRRIRPRAPRVRRGRPAPTATIAASGSTRAWRAIRNAGHEGGRYGTELPAADKDALVEFLKTF